MTDKLDPSLDSRFKAALDNLVYLSPAQPRPAPSASDRPAWRLGDRGDLLRRLCTFKPSLWCAKPDIVGPVACARRGWIAQEPDLIACEFCNAKIHFPVQRDWTPTQLDEFAQRVAAQLDTSHTALCAWKGNACPPAVTEFPPLPKTELIAGLQERTAALNALAHLPAVAFVGLEAYPEPPRRMFDALVAQRLAEDPPGAAHQLREVSERAITLIALTGWRLDSLPHASPAADEAQRQVLRCDFCGAVAGLWNFKQGAPPPSAAIYSPPLLAMPSTPGGGAGGSQQSQTPRTNITALFFAHPPSAGKPAAPPAPVAPGLPQPLYDLRLTIAGGAGPTAGSGEAAPRPFGSGSSAPAFGLSAAAGSAGPAVSEAPALSPAPSAAGKRPADSSGAGPSPSPKAPRVASASGSAADTAAGAPQQQPPQGAGRASGATAGFDPLLQHRRHCGWVCGAPAALEEADAATFCALAVRRCGWMRTLAAAAPPLPDEEHRPAGQSAATGVSAGISSAAATGGSLGASPGGGAQMAGEGPSAGGGPPLKAVRNPPKVVVESLLAGRPISLHAPTARADAALASAAAAGVGGSGGAKQREAAATAAGPSSSTTAGGGKDHQAEQQQQHGNGGGAASSGGK